MPEFVHIIIGWLAFAEVRAILAGLVISWNGTQLIKNAPILVDAPESERRWKTRALAFVLGLVPTAIMWPGPLLEQIMIGAAVGLASPAIYTYGARILYHYFPWIEVKMSASPPETRQGEPR